jgi:hypothetical protein
MLAKSLEKSESPSVLFNIALTCHLSGDTAKAIEFIDRALPFIKKTSAPSAPRPANYQTLRAIDLAALLRPIDSEYEAGFPELAREDILCCGAIIAHGAELHAKASAYLSGLHSPEFQELKDKLNGKKL